MQTYRSQDGKERRQLWMDKARGSGLWYWRGHTLTIPDLRSCVGECDASTRSQRMYERARVHETLVIDHRIGDDGQLLQGVEILG